MPQHIRTAEEFKARAASALECRVVRRPHAVKLKLRTPKMLYTFVTTEEESEGLLKELKVDIIEL